MPICFSEDDLPAKVEKSLAENKKLQREIEKLKAELYSGKTVDVDSESDTVGEIKVLAKFVEGVDPKELRALSDNLKTKVGSGIVMLVTESESKTSLLISITKDIAGKYNADEIIKKVVQPIEGTGGGRADMAQGGAPEVGKFETLKKTLIAIINGM